MYGMLLTISEPILIHYYSLKSTLYSDFFSFYLISSRIPYYTFSHHVFLGFIWLWQFLEISVFEDLDSFEGCWIFCRMALSWDLWDVFLWWLEIWVCGRKTSEGRCPLITSCQVLLTWVVLVDVDLAHLAEIVFAGFLHCKLPLCLTHTLRLPPCILRKGVTMHNPQLRRGGN